MYGHGGSDKVRGLVFVSRVEEAYELSRHFNLASYKTLSLSGADDDRGRENAIQLLPINHTMLMANHRNILIIFLVLIFL